MICIHISNACIVYVYCIRDLKEVHPGPRTPRLAPRRPLGAARGPGAAAAESWGRPGCSSCFFCFFFFFPGEAAGKTASCTYVCIYTYICMYS